MNQDPVKQQYLTVSQYKKFKNKKFWVHIYLGTDTDAGRMELFTSEKVSKKKTPDISLIVKDVIKTVLIEDKPEFVIGTRNDTYTFTAERMTDAHDWITFIRSVMNSANPEVVEVNDIYGATSSSQIQREFTVTSTSETENQWGIRGECRLIIENGYIILRATTPKDCFFKWCLSNIRRFGFRANILHFEAGRKCESGEGYFYFSTTKGKEIHALLTEAKKVAKKRMERVIHSQATTKAMAHSPPNTVPRVTERNSEEPALEGHIYDSISQDETTKGPIDNQSSVLSSTSKFSLPPRNTTTSNMTATITTTTTTNTPIYDNIQGLHYKKNESIYSLIDESVKKNRQTYSEVTKMQGHEYSDLRGIHGHTNPSLTHTGNETEGNEKRKSSYHPRHKVTKEFSKPEDEAVYNHLQH
ncbi:docking protein 5-like isoform X2 [Oratosquilla oratoria]|uniref:docking protein 5-like isoform X2 n=1 Tax=Oratosquilla oratoria TaxID=337810 RepID=UPI003F7669DF